MTDRDSPFGSARGPRPAAMLAFVAATLLVALAVWRFARRGEPAVTTLHHSESGGDSAMPVSLQPAEAQRIGVTYAVVTSGALGHEVRVVGVVQADETRIRTVTSRVDGFVERLQADFTGQPVRAGATLLDLYSPMAVAAQQDLLLAAKLEHDVADGTEDARRAARGALDAARQRLRQWEVPADAIAEVERTGTPGRTFPVRSTWSGFVLEKSVLQGQRVMAGDPLYRIADLSVVWLEGEVFEQDLPLLRVGTEVTATFQALPGAERRGRISYVYPTLNPETRTARVRVPLSNADMRLKPGMYATLTFIGQAATGLSVPRSAVLATGKRNLVFLKGQGSRFEPREVTIGVSSDDRVQVLHGLAAGDTVVASATFLIDAESNLGSMLGGMGNMPGMDMGPPTPTGGAPTPPPPTDHSTMPGMDHSQQPRAR